MIDPLKDVDGLTPISAGLLAQGREGLRPCTPQGVMTLLDAAGAQLEGAEAVVIGRSNLFGKPMAQLLLGANATVTTCHSRTRDLAAVCRRADVLIAAVGRARMVQADWVKPGAIVIDVGMNRTEDGLAGDVDFDAVREVARRDHAGARRRRPDDDRLPAAQHAAGGADAARRGGGRVMDARRLRSGELLTAAGAAGLAVVLFADWFGGRSGWSTMTVGRVLLVLTIAARADARRPDAAARARSRWRSSAAA